MLPPLVLLLVCDDFTVSVSDILGETSTAGTGRISAEQSEPSDARITERRSSSSKNSLSLLMKKMKMCCVDLDFFF